VEEKEADDPLPPNPAVWDDEAGAFFVDVPLSPKMPNLTPQVPRRTQRERHSNPRYFS